jgi:hypothetical protein
LPLSRVWLANTEVSVYFTTRHELSSDYEAVEPFEPFKTFKRFKSWTATRFRLRLIRLRLRVCEKIRSWFDTLTTNGMV